LWVFGGNEGLKKENFAEKGRERSGKRGDLYERCFSREGRPAKSHYSVDKMGRGVFKNEKIYYRGRANMEKRKSSEVRRERFSITIGGEALF